MYNKPSHFSLDHALIVYPLQTYFINAQAKSKFVVCGMYNIFAKASYTTILFDTLWKVIWTNLPLLSKSPNHQIIHYKLHRAYLSPCRLSQMKTRVDACCSFCSGDTNGTFILLVWDYCPKVKVLLGKRVLFSLRSVEEMDSCITRHITPQWGVICLGEETSPPCWALCRWSGGLSMNHHTLYWLKNGYCHTSRALL